MNIVILLTRRVMVEEVGVAATEYAIMLALIVVAVIGAISGLGFKMDTIFTTLDNGVNSAAAP